VRCYLLLERGRGLGSRGDEMVVGGLAGEGALGLISEVEMYGDGRE
jgi:hypothetical protein